MKQNSVKPLQTDGQTLKQIDNFSGIARYYCYYYYYYCYYYAVGKATLVS